MERAAWAARAADVRVSDERLTVELTDGREVSISLTEFPELAAATSAQRANWTITALGTAIFFQRGFGDAEHAGHRVRWQ